LGNKTADPYPVTIADIDRQMADARSGRQQVSAESPRSSGRGLVTRAKDSLPHLIQHT
jgi:hypothetical protein